MEQIGSKGMDYNGKEWIVMRQNVMERNGLCAVVNWETWVQSRLSNFIQNHIPQGLAPTFYSCREKDWIVLLTVRRGCTSCGASSASTAATGMHRGEPTNKAQPKQLYIETYYAKL